MDVLFVHGLERVAGWLREAGARQVAILAPPSRRFVAALEAACADFAPTVFAGAQVHVPAEVVDAALLATTGCDTIIAIGGGSPIGLGKALKLRRELRFVAVPTTYAGSEMTMLYGITTGTAKQTGRDPRVRPDLVVYDVELTRDLPLPLSVQSLFNALAHVISALSTDSLAGGVRAGALSAAVTVVRAIDGLVADPTSLEARELAQRGASACASAIDQGKPGVQHQLAHLLGGALRLDHARLHAALLPEFVAHLRRHQPVLVGEIEQAVGRASLEDHRSFAGPRGARTGDSLGREASLGSLESHLREVLRASGAPVTLGASVAAVTAALATRPELPAHVAIAAADDYLA